MRMLRDYIVSSKLLLSDKRLNIVQTTFERHTPRLVDSSLRGYVLKPSAVNGTGTGMCISI